EAVAQDLEQPKQAAQAPSGASGRLSVPERQKPSGKFQRAGGTQLQFLQMLEGNKNSKAPLPEGTLLTEEEVAKYLGSLSLASCEKFFLFVEGHLADSQVFHVSFLRLSARIEITLYIDFHPGGKRQIMQGRKGYDCFVSESASLGQSMPK
ncbi:unnamed protein product, partial [Cladocopium goreaui]